MADEEEAVRGGEDDGSEEGDEAVEAVNALGSTAPR